MMARKRMRFEDKSFTIEHGGVTVTVKGLSGWRDADGEIVFDAESARRYTAAGDELVLRDRERQRKEIRRIRKKLHLSQVEASRLTGGGHNAFSRYERGEATPLLAVRNLFRLLDNHPDLLKELQTEEHCYTAHAIASRREVAAHPRHAHSVPRNRGGELRQREAGGDLSGEQARDAPHVNKV
jgi:HTH-type transcriptional regulator / antitoxin MqsA